MSKYFSNPITPKQLNKDMLFKMASTIVKANKERSLVSTYCWNIGQDAQNRWYLAAGWMEGFYKDINLNEERLCMKIAYIPKDAFLRDYDYDFLMPYDSEGNVWDTEISIGEDATEGSLFYDITYLLQEFEKMIKESETEAEKAA